MNEKIVYQWEEELASHLPQLTSGQLSRVAVLVPGIIHAEHCQQGAVALPTE